MSDGIKLLAFDSPVSPFESLELLQQYMPNFSLLKNSLAVIRNIVSIAAQGDVAQLHSSGFLTKLVIVIIDSRASGVSSWSWKLQNANEFSRAG